MTKNPYHLFEIPGVLSVDHDEHGLAVLSVKNQHADARIYLLGGQVTSFTPKGGKDLLWLSPHSSFVEGKAIRGGIPVCWPWFGPNSVDKNLPNHGFVRTRIWNLVSALQLSDGRTQIKLGLDADEETRKIWPQDFTLRLVATIGPELEVELVTTNTGLDLYTYEDALHTYFSVSEAAQVRVEGFDGVSVLDRVQGAGRRVQEGDIGFPGEVDQTMFGSNGQVTIHDPGMQRRIVVRQENARASVVWNPGPHRAEKMADVLETWRGFVCLESANCTDVPVVLLPNSSHRTTVFYSVQTEE